MLPRIFSQRQLFNRVVLGERWSKFSEQQSAIHSSAPLTSKKAGRHKTTRTQDKPLTYEEANKPDMIGVRKGFNSFNTSSLALGLRKPEIFHEEVFIRKFVHGTWPKLLMSDVIIKRRANIIVLNFMAQRIISPQKMHFLIGYTEEILSYFLKCIVKVELQTIDDPSDMTYKYI